MAAQLYYSPFIPAFSPNGLPVPGAKLFFFYSGTDNLAPVYTDSTLGVRARNPVVADLAARFDPVYLDEAITYRVRLVDPLGIQLGDDIDPYVPGQSLKGEPGDPGPSNNTRISLASIKAANISDKTSLYDGSLWTWTPGNYSATPADQLDRDVIKADSTPLSTGAWIRQRSDRVVFDGRTVDSKLSEIISVKDSRFGARGDGSTDDTAAFNLATSAATTHIGNETPLKRSISVPGAKYTLNGTVYVRKGQSLDGGGRGTSYINALGASSNTNSSVVFAKGSSGVVDPGGLFVSATNMLLEGGPLGNGLGLIDTSSAAGWSVEGITFLNCSTGVIAGGTDGQVSDCYFDINAGQNGMKITGQTITVAASQFYLGNYQQTIQAGAKSVFTTGCTFSYFQYAGVFIEDAVDGASDLSWVGCSFVQNVQYGTTLGAVVIRGNNIRLSYDSCSFYNIKGPAITRTSGLGTKLSITGCEFDGLRTAPLFDQSTTMQGLICGNMDTTIQASVFRSLPGQPVTFDGSFPSTLILQNVRFQGNTGGTAEINITNTNPSSRVILIGCVGSGRPLVNAQSTVEVIQIGCDDGVSPARPLLASAATLTLPPYRDVIQITGTTAISNITATKLDAGRRVTLIFEGGLTVTSGSSLSIASTFVTTPSDTLTLVCNGMTWFEAARSIN